MIITDQSRNGSYRYIRLSVLSNVYVGNQLYNNIIITYPKGKLNLCTWKPYKESYIKKYDRGKTQFDNNKII